MRRSDAPTGGEEVVTTQQATASPVYVQLQETSISKQPVVTPLLLLSGLPVAAANISLLCDDVERERDCGCSNIGDRGGGEIVGGVEAI